jgi:DNA polymerase-3 subunit beta
MRTSIPVESRGGSLKVAVPSRILLDILKNLPEQPVTVTVNKDNFGIEISSDNGRYKLNGENGLDFPKIPAPENTQSVHLPSKSLLRALNKTLFAASTDEDKQALNGVLFSLGKNGITMVATDAHRLVRFRIPEIKATDPASFIVPAKALNLVKGSFDNSEEPVVIEYSASNAFFLCGNIMLACRLIDQKFPDYENVIPTNNPGKLVIKTRDLLGAVRRVNIFANKTSHQVRFKITGNELTVSAEDLDFSNEAKENLNCVYEGDSMEIGFNASLLVDVIANVEKDEMVIELSTPNRAGIILPTEQEDGENILMLVMPVMLNSYVGV